MMVIPGPAHGRRGERLLCSLFARIKKVGELAKADLRLPTAFD